jgi:hypothetical protein
MLAVMPSVTCRIRRSDFGVKTVGFRSGVFHRMEDTRVSNCSFAAQRLIENSSNRLVSCNVAADRLAGVHDAEADERNL